jgi:hypothetical protein
MQFDNTVISLERTRCYGTCPAYTLVVLADGTVIFHSPTYFVDEGKMNVQKSLRPIVSKISIAQVNQIVEEFEKANYFALLDKYVDKKEGGCPMEASDSSTVFTSIQIGEKKKSIQHYLGCTYGWKEIPRKGFPVKELPGPYPKELFDLENKIDEIVNIEQWLK